ncbi:MAG: UDP-N-acetylmuramoyl-L-alanyl-D-glutamate--2,6-diaminopimelate ligase [Gemmatimonadales bacterium]
MTLVEIVALLRARDLVVSAPNDGLDVTELAVDSRQAVPGSCFIAIRGSVDDGTRFVADAVVAGAVLVVSEEAADAGVPVVVVTDARHAAEVLAAEWYQRPADSLVLHGITGTNGKTTTTALLRHLLNAAATAGSIGTLGAFDGTGRTVASTAGTLTTPGPLDLQATLRALLDAGVTDVVMETSSHALHQGRLDGLVFDSGVFTNLTRDHLDYHQTMDAYREAKLRLIDLVSGDGVLAINSDEPAWEALCCDRRAVTWGLGADAMVRITEIAQVTAGSRFHLAGRFGAGEVNLPLPGDFNISNAVAAAAVVLGRGMPMAEVVRRLESSPQVPGRMERIIDAPFHVIRDYAHTPDALERALATLRPITPGRIIVLFGCGGDRDRGKRPMMGQVAAAGADHVIVTSDNPRTEDPDQIIDDIVQGMPAGSYEREVDRLVAISIATGGARAGDAVLLAGKGHETYQVIGTESVPFDERSIVRSLVR